MSDSGASRSPSAIGLAPGAEGAGVMELQEFLGRFGYLPGNGADPFTPLRAQAPAPEAEPGRFDTATERGLRAYQRFNGLPLTGELDEATVAHMSLPRCGFPDTGPSGAHLGFVAQGSRWGTTNLRFGFENFSSDLSEAQVRDAVVQSFAMWSAVTPLEFREVPIGEDPEIRIRFTTGDHGHGSTNAFDGSGGTLAHAFYPPPGGGGTAGDACFDEAETWSVALPVPAGSFDLIMIMVHEFGHALGLNHTDVAGAIMRPTFASGATQRFLAQDDIDGIRSIYGAGDWQPLGGLFLAAPSAARNADGRLEIFGRGTDSAVWHRWQTAPSNGWSDGWASLGGGFTSDLAVAQNADGRLEVFGRGTDNALWHRWQTAPSNGWADGWASLGGLLTSKPVVARNHDGRLEVFVRGTDNALWHRWQTAPSNGWSNGWGELGGGFTSEPVVTQNADGRLEIFARGTDGAVWHRWQTAPSNGWVDGWHSLGGGIIGAPVVGRNADGRLELFVRGTDDALWHRWQTAPSNGWVDGWHPLGGRMTHAPTVAQNHDGRLEVFVRGTDNALWHRWQTAPSNGWVDGWHSLGGVLTSEAVLHNNADGRLELLVRGADNALWHRWQTAPSNGWN